jgi:signal transduction histidine kinase
VSEDHIPQSKKTIQSLWKLQKIILETLDFTQVVQKVVDSIAIELDYLDLGYQTVVLALVDEPTQTLRRISMSQTPAAEAIMGAGKMSFDEIVIPLSAADNFCIKTLLDQEVRSTTDWKDILTPPMTAEEARHLQQVSKVRNSVIYPVITQSKCIGVMIFSLSKDVSQISLEEKDLLTSFIEIISLAIHDSQLYSNLQVTTKELKIANDKLIVLDKAKDDFVSLASHELRTPMTAIKSYTWMVLNGKAGVVDVKARKYLDVVYSSTERLIHLVNEMLDVSRIESGKVQLRLETFDVAGLFETIRDEFAAKAFEQKLNLVFNLPPSVIPQLSADREKIVQVLENLIGNAFKFTPPGGTVTVNAAQTDHQIQFSVNDTGPGIAPQDLPKLFQKFGRLENTLIASTGASTGLGLFICRQYVELHSGKIWAESELGHGSTFTFSLPL